MLFPVQHLFPYCFQTKLVLKRCLLFLAYVQTIGVLILQNSKKGFSPTLPCIMILYCVLDEHFQCDFVICSSQVGWTKVVHSYQKHFLICNHLVLIFFCDFTCIHMCFVLFCPLLVNGQIHLLDYNVKFVKCQFLNFMKTMILSFIHLLSDCEKQSIVINVFSKAVIWRHSRWCVISGVPVRKCPHDPYICLHGQNRPYTPFTPKSVFPLTVIIMLTEPPTL